MKFSELVKNPNLKYFANGYNHIYGYTVFESRRKHSCCQCGEPTNFIDYYYEAPMCSEECSNKTDKEYTEACN